jgi:dihydroorotate dehydrogenase (fumarate)
MIDISTSYMGIRLKNPVIAGASGFTSNVKTIKKIEEAGAGAVVCKSLFEEEINLEKMKQEKDNHMYDNLNPEMITVFPEVKYSGPENHLYWITEVKKAAGIPVFASLNAVTEDTWIEYSKLIEETGVDGLELNFYSSPVYSRDNSDLTEQKQIKIIKKIRESVNIPISVKLSSFYTNISGFIHELDKIGINGFVLFNRFFQSNIDIIKEEVTFPFLFSHKVDNRMPLRFTGLLYGNISGSICCNTGIMDYDDVVRMILAGADAVEVVSTFYKNGIHHLESIIKGITDWMEIKGYGSIDDFIGKLSRKALSSKDSWVYNRTQYIKMLMQGNEKLAEKIF